MKAGLVVIGALALGAFTAHALLEDSGYVLIEMRGYAVEMSLPGLILAAALLYLAIRLLVRLWRAPRQLGRAAGRYRDQRARARLTRGLIAIAEGDSAKGERILARGAGRSDAPLLNYLTAARAAQQQGAEDRRDTWLRLAFEREPEAAPAILVTQAELQMDRGQLEQALATLDRLLAAAPGHPRGTVLQGEVYRRLGRWQDLESLLPALAKLRSVDAETVSALREETAAALLSNAAANGQPERVEKIWRQLPKPLRSNPALITDYVRALARCGDHDQLEKTIRRFLKVSWNPSLVEIYGELETSNPSAPLGHAEAWLTRRGEDPVLLTTVARLCMRSQLWGKARSYLETSLGIRPDPVGYRLYGQLLQTMGEEEGAAEAFRLGLETATTSAPLPALAGPSRRR